MDHSATAARIASIKEALGNRSIVLVGLMGAGKSSVGRRLARHLELPFTDADVEIEKAAGKTIPEIFADHGEQYFRDGERRVIARLLESGPRVLATGGGAYMNSETRARVKEHGVSVWLRAPVDLLLKRVSRRSNRPLLQNGNRAEILQRLMVERHPVYALADVVVDSRDAPHEMIVHDIIDRLSEYLLMEQDSPCQ